MFKGIIKQSLEPKYSNSGKGGSNPRYHPKLIGKSALGLRDMKKYVL